MANKKLPNRALSGEQLTKAIAEKIFGWKNVRKHDGELIGKKQDKLGRGEKRRYPTTPATLFTDTLSTNA